MSPRILTDLIDVCCGYFSSRGFHVDELPRLDASLEWRPKLLVARDQHPTPVKAAIEVRENQHLDPDVLIEPIREARKLMPDLPIFFAIPLLGDDEMHDIERKVASIGVGMYVIEEQELRRVRDADVPFQEDRRAIFPIRPDAEYRNRVNVRKMLFRCYDKIDWLDKHFTFRGLEILHEHLSDRGFVGISAIRILTGATQVTNRFTNDYRALMAELNRHNVSVRCRILSGNDFRATHDRYVISPNIAFNVLPVESLIRGQTGELSETDAPPDFQSLWNRATPI